MSYSPSNTLKSIRGIGSITDGVDDANDELAKFRTCSF